MRYPPSEVKRAIDRANKRYPGLSRAVSKALRHKSLSGKEEDALDEVDNMSERGALSEIKDMMFDLSSRMRQLERDDRGGHGGNVIDKLIEMRMIDSMLGGKQGDGSDKILGLPPGQAILVGLTLGDKLGWFSGKDEARESLGRLQHEMEKRDQAWGNKLDQFQVQQNELLRELTHGKRLEEVQEDMLRLRDEQERARQQDQAERQYMMDQMVGRFKDHNPIDEVRAQAKDITKLKDGLMDLAGVLGGVSGYAPPQSAQGWAELAGHLYERHGDDLIRLLQDKIPDGSFDVVGGLRAIVEGAGEVGSAVREAVPEMKSAAWEEPSPEPPSAAPLRRASNPIHESDVGRIA